MFACVVDDVDKKYSGASKQLFLNYDELIQENKDIRRRLKRLSSLLIDAEAQRSSDRVQYEKKITDKDKAHSELLMERNTSHMMEMAQVLYAGDAYMFFILV